MEDNNKLLQAIFDNIESMEELYKISKSFAWLIENHFLEKENAIYELSQIAFRRICNTE